MKPRYRKHEGTIKAPFLDTSSIVATYNLKKKKKKKKYCCYLLAFEMRIIAAGPTCIILLSEIARHCKHI